jgi:hypothetical protein
VVLVDKALVNGVLVKQGVGERGVCMNDFSFE